MMVMRCQTSAPLSGAMPVFAPFRGCASHRFTGGLDYFLTDTPEGGEGNSARLLIGQSPTAAGGRGREGDCRKKHGGLQAERSKSPMFLTDGVVSSSLTGAAKKNHAPNGAWFFFTF